jgi:hypothetical protein
VARQFLADVQRSANRVLRFTGDDEPITVTVEAHGMDTTDAIRAAVREVAHIYLTVPFQTNGDPRPIGFPSAD